MTATTFRIGMAAALLVVVVLAVVVLDVFGNLDSQAVTAILGAIVGAGVTLAGVTTAVAVSNGKPDDSRGAGV